MDKVDNAVMIILTAQKSINAKLKKIGENFGVYPDGILSFLNAELDMIEKAVCSMYDKKYTNELTDAFMDYYSGKKDILDIINTLKN